MRCIRRDLIHYRHQRNYCLLQTSLRFSKAHSPVSEPKCCVVLPVQVPLHDLFIFPDFYAFIQPILNSGDYLSLDHWQ